MLRHTGVDMANLPRAVRAQVEAADAFLASQAPAQDSPGNTLADMANQADETPPEPQQAETPPAQAQAEPENRPPATQKSDKPDVWEARYKSLDGIFRAEVPKLQSQVKELTSRLQEMEKTAQAPAATQEQPKPGADPKDVDSFGADLVDMVQRVAQQMLGGVAAKVEAAVGSIDKRLTQLEHTAQGTSQAVAVTAEEMFFNRLSKSTPDWEAINASAPFLEWLGEVDPMLGQPRQSALASAQQALDVNRVTAIFQAFKATQPTTQPKRSSSVEKQVSPSSVANAAPAPTDKPVLTEAQVQAFYKDVALGKYRGRDAEVERLERVINQAMAENRIR